MGKRKDGRQRLRWPCTARRIWTLLLLGVPAWAYSAGFAQEVVRNEITDLIAQKAVTVVNEAGVDVKSVDAFLEDDRQGGRALTIVLFHPLIDPETLLGQVCVDFGGADVVKTILLNAATTLVSLELIAENPDDAQKLGVGQELIAALAGFASPEMVEVVSGSFTSAEIAAGRILDEDYSGDYWLLGQSWEEGGQSRFLSICE